MDRLFVKNKYCIVRSLYKDRSWTLFEHCKRQLFKWKTEWILFY